MIRSLKVIAFAINIASPSTPKASVDSYAKVIKEEAKKRHFDPLTLVAMVYNESKWNPRVINSINCVGLGQVCLSNYPYCRKDISSARCQAKKAQLQDGVYNLRVISRSITLNRKFCRKRTGKPALWRYWLASHGGYNVPSRGVWCGQRKVLGKWQDEPIPKTLKRIMRYRKKLIKRTHEARR